MSTKKFSDSNPIHWSLKGGRWNSFSRHRGMFGLWYLVEKIGQGRFADQWAIFVFSDSVKVSGYAGSNREYILNDYLSSKILFQASGRGGYDFGKGLGSKGGYREGGSIPFEFNGVEFNGDLLSDGDEFLIQVVGIQPGLDIQAQISEKIRVAAEIKERQAQAFRLEYSRRISEAEERLQIQLDLFRSTFKDFVCPDGFTFEITSDGLKLSRVGSSDIRLFSSVEKADWFIAEQIELKEMFEASVKAEAHAKALEFEKSSARSNAVLSFQGRIREVLNSGSNLQDTIDFLKSL